MFYEISMIFLFIKSFIFLFLFLLFSSPYIRKGYFFSGSSISITFTLYHLYSISFTYLYIFPFSSIVIFLSYSFNFSNFSATVGILPALNLMIYSHLFFIHISNICITPFLYFKIKKRYLYMFILSFFSCFDIFFSKNFLIFSPEVRLLYIINYLQNHNYV